MSNEHARTIRVHQNDNVTIVAQVQGLPKGSVLEDGTILIEDVPFGHKVALCDLEDGSEIRRYNEIIALAKGAIAKGSWISDLRVSLPPARDLEQLAFGTRSEPVIEPLEAFTFEGYRNADGSVGTRNILGITTSVQCVAGVVDHAVQRIKDELLPRFPNVDDVLALNHAYGCGVAIQAPEAVIPIRTLQNLALNPNFGGEIMIIGLGCEKLIPENLLLTDEENSTILRLQEERFTGFAAMVDEILIQAEAHLERLNGRTRQPCPVSDLVVGMQCGGSDAFSGITANPAVGFATDLIVRGGGSVMFSEVTEVRDAVHLMAERVADATVGKALIREMTWYDNYLDQGGVDRSANTTPGNKQGGLSGIIEKALGSIAKSGSSPIVDVLAPGERLRKKGLTFAATPASDFVCGTLQLASGMNIQVFTTGRGTPYNLAAAPVIKVATNSALATRWHDLMDLDAGRIATGDATIEQVGWELFRMILDVASDRKRTAADRLGLHNALTLFNPAPIT